MRPLFHLRWLLLLAIGLGSRSLAYASHILGGDIAYRPTASTTAGLPRYHVTVRLFVNPTTFDQRTVTLLATQSSCSAPASNSFQLDNIPRSSLTPGTWASCTGGIVYAIALYETDVNLVPGQWTLAFVGENRVNGILNINSSSSSASTTYLATTFNSSLTTQDASPVFESDALPILTSAAQPNFSFSAFDADGDSLNYAFTLAQSVQGGLASTQGGATCATPIANSLSLHFSLNAFTGVLTRQAGGPTWQGYYVMAARVSEYRRLGGQWQLLGSAIREVLYLLVASSNEPPTFTSASVNGGPAQSPDQPIPAVAGQTVQVTLTATDPDAGQLLSFSSGAPRNVPGLSFTTLSATQAQLSWQVPADQPPGRYHVPVAVADNGCPYSASEDRTLWFTVRSNRPLGTRPDAVALASAYPTPFHEQVQFAAPAGQAVQVTDALGREVARLLAGPDGLVRWLPAADLPTGLYLARLAGSGQPLARLLRAE